MTDKYYGYIINKDKTATLSLMTRTEKGKGVAGSRWAATFIKTDNIRKIESECENLNYKLSDELGLAEKYGLV